MELNLEMFLFKRRHFLKRVLLFIKLSWADSLCLLNQRTESGIEVEISELEEKLSAVIKPVIYILIIMIIVFAIVFVID